MDMWPICRTWAAALLWPACTLLNPSSSLAVTQWLVVFSDASCLDMTQASHTGLTCLRSCAQGLYVNARNAAGDTPLHLAAANQRDAAARVLLAAGADTELRNARGRRPLDALQGSAAPRWSTSGGRSRLS